MYRIPEYKTQNVSPEYLREENEYMLVEHHGLGENISYIMFKPYCNDEVKVDTGFEVKGDGTIKDAICQILLREGLFCPIIHFMKLTEAQVSAMYHNHADSPNFKAFVRAYTSLPIGIGFVVRRDTSINTLETVHRLKKNKNATTFAESLGELRKLKRQPLFPILAMRFKNGLPLHKDPVENERLVELLVLHTYMSTTVHSPDTPQMAARDLLTIYDYDSLVSKMRLAKNYSDSCAKTSTHHPLLEVYNTPRQESRYFVETYT